MIKGRVISLKKSIYSLISNSIFFLVFVFMVGTIYCKNKELVLTYSTFAPVGYPYLYDISKLYVDLVNKKGKGIVRINPYYGGVLLRGENTLPGLQAGIADIVFVVCGRATGVLPILGIWNIPVWDSMESASKALAYGSPAMEIVNKNIAKKNFFMIPTGNAVEFIFVKKVINSLSELKGLKIRTAGAVEGKVIRAIGAVPVVMPSADIPQSLQRGIIDGVLITVHTASGRKIEEFTKTMIVYPFAFQGGGLLFAKSRWESWPKKVQKILIEAGKEWGRKSIGYKHDTILSEYQIKNKIIPFYKKAGLKIYYPTPEEIKTIKKKLKPIAIWWAKKVGKDGFELLKYTDYNK